MDGSAIATTNATDVTSSGWQQVDELSQLIIWIVLVEYIFRGWILQAVGACTFETRCGPVGRALSVLFRTPWPAIVISAALFAGWVAVRTCGLEASTAQAVVYRVGLGIRTGNGDDLPWQHVITNGAALLFTGRCGVAGPSSAHPYRQLHGNIGRSDLVCMT